MKDSDIDFQTPEAVENAFYSAFTECNTQAMSTVWANDDIICIHPGSSVLVGYTAVMRSWQNILSNAEPPHLYVEVLNCYVTSDLAVHVVKEHIRSEAPQSESVTVVLATNIYRRGPYGWRMIEHHASVPSNARRQHTLQ